MLMGCGFGKGRCGRMLANFIGDNFLIIIALLLAFVFGGAVRVRHTRLQKLNNKSISKNIYLATLQSTKFMYNKC